MNPTPTTWKAARRLHAWRLKEKGWPQRQIADALGVSEGAVSQWMKRAREGGPEALRHRPPPGAPRRLSAAPRAQVPALWPPGPEASGLRGQLWTRGRIAAVIHRGVGVSYHPRHGGRLCQMVLLGEGAPIHRRPPSGSSWPRGPPSGSTWSGSRPMRRS